MLIILLNGNDNHLIAINIDSDLIIGEFSDCQRSQDLEFLTILSCLGFGLCEEGKARAEEKGYPA